ncbi:hypothetical protein GCM10022215_03370 [Nocardioides fonticola]|uniref:N-acetyltransferase domain-containing protein n=2 Tax=Nocardioides fonticola TaxID=450363 RepID=A0ABP7XAA5_9ACTN
MRLPTLIGMTAPDPERVHAASAAWIYVPSDAVEVSTPEYRLVRYPSWMEAGVELVWLGPLRRTVRLVVEEVVEIATGWDVDHLTWWVRGGHPGEFEREVLRRGATLKEEVQVLAAPIATALDLLDPPDDVVVTEVAGLADLRAATDVGAAAFGTAPLDDDQLTDALRAMTEMPEAPWFLATRGGAPVGMAGATLAGDVVRLWGGGVAPEARGHGVYRAMLAERLRWARERGADLALVKGRVATSAPILRRAGFTAYGTERGLRMPLR